MVKNFVNKVNSVQDEVERKKRVTRKRGYPDAGAKLVALKAEDLLEDDKFECHICNTIFCREQNLELHLRSHENVPPRKKATAQYNRNMAFICPVPDCVHHDLARALSDITAIKKHYRRKHGEKKWKCSFCPKTYAVDADCKQHEKKSHRDADHRCECPKSSKGKKACECNQGFVSMREDNLHPTTSNGQFESRIPSPTFVNNSSGLNINDPLPYYPEFELPLVNQPPPIAPTTASVSLLNINEPPQPYHPEFEAEQNHANILALAHNNELAQQVVAEQNYANIAAPVHDRVVAPDMQITSSSTFLSEFELDFLASNSTITFTDMLHYGMPSSPMDGAASRGTVLNPKNAGSYKTMPPGISPNNLEQQRDDLNINISLGLNSQGFVPPTFAPNTNTSNAGLYQTMSPSTNRNNLDHQWTNLTMCPLWLNSQGFVPPAFAPNTSNAGLCQTMSSHTNGNNFDHQRNDLTLYPLWLKSQGLSTTPEQ